MSAESAVPVKASEHLWMKTGDLLRQKEKFCLVPVDGG